MKKQSIIIVGLILIMVSVLFCGCNGRIVEVDEEMVELSTWHFTSGVANNLITVNHSDANAIFEMRVDKGALLSKSSKEYDTKIIVNNGVTSRWDPIGVVEAFESAYMDVIAKVDDNIVGYAVVRICSDNALGFSAEVVKSVTFPQVNGQYQTVTQKQVEAKIKAAKK